MGLLRPGATCLLLAGFVTILPGCPPVNQAAEDIQSAINAIDADGSSWLTQLQSLETELNTDAQNLVGQVDLLIQNGVAVTGAEVRCDVNFIAQETANALQGLLAQVEPGVQAPQLVPAICQVVPSTVEMSDPPGVVNFYGYNFDATGANLTLIYNHDGATDNASQYLSVVSPYLATANISQPDGLPVCNEQDRSLVLETGSQPLSTVAFVAATCPSGYYEPGPAPTTRTLTDPVDYSLSGGLFGASSNFTAGSACTPGYARVDPPQINDLTNSGDCGISWASGSSTDCTVNVHEGVAALQSVECLVTITEMAVPVWVPPPPCPCQ